MKTRQFDGVFNIKSLQWSRTEQHLGTLKENRTVKVRCIFWWERADSLGINACAQNVTIWLHFVCQIYLFSNQTTSLYGLHHKPHHAKTKTHRKGVFVFWWERVESNHLSQRQQIYSLPRLSDSGARPKLIYMNLRCKLMVRAEGIEPSFQAWKACILAFELCSL